MATISKIAVCRLPAASILLHDRILGHFLLHQLQQLDTHCQSSTHFKSDTQQQLVVKPGSFNQTRCLTAMAGQSQAGFTAAANSAIPGLRRTVWDQQDLQVEYPKLEQDIETDVVIVGGGLAGISVAYPNNGPTSIVRNQGRSEQPASDVDREGCWSPTSKQLLGRLDIDLRAR